MNKDVTYDKQTKKKDLFKDKILPGVMNTWHHFMAVVKR